MRFCYGKRMWTKNLRAWNPVQCATLFFTSKPTSFQIWNAKHATITSIRIACSNGSEAVARALVSFVNSHGAGPGYDQSSDMFTIPRDVASTLLRSGENVKSC
mmetsp:Transcript_1770/g.3145  ORF Transcript_1770/g.3145 Transcript_1770/m.3145 type:complete len:103 (+) Transcript_1770:2078-2386(+)